MTNNVEQRTLNWCSEIILCHPPGQNASSNRLSWKAGPRPIGLICIPCRHACWRWCFAEKQPPIIRVSHITAQTMSQCTTLRRLLLRNDGYLEFRGHSHDTPKEDLQQRLIRRSEKSGTHLLPHHFRLLIITTTIQVSSKRLYLFDQNPSNWEFKRSNKGTKAIPAVL